MYNFSNRSILNINVVNMFLSYEQMLLEYNNAQTLEIWTILISIQIEIHTNGQEYGMNGQ